MTHSKLKLNDDKTEALLIHSHRQSHVSFPNSITVGHSNIPFSSHARNLGFIISGDLSLNRHVSHICRSAYIAIRQVSAIRRYLTVEATKTLMCALVLSRLDYCNSLLSGCPKNLLNKLQLVQNAAARLVYKAKKRDHVTPLLHSLHWLPVQARIEYKLSVICHNHFIDCSPPYISEILSVYTPSRCLRSSSDKRTFCIPKTHTRSYGERSFAFSGPKQFNSLPPNIRDLPTTSSFKKALKTHLFKKYFMWFLIITTVYGRCMTNCWCIGRMISCFECYVLVCMKHIFGWFIFGCVVFMLCKAHWALSDRGNCA